MKNFLNLSVAIVAALSISSCDFPGHSPESVAKSYVQGVCDFNASALFENAAVRDDIDADLKDASKEALQKLLDENISNKSFPFSVKGTRLKDKSEHHATVVVYYQTRGFEDDSIKIRLVSEGKLLKKWYVQDDIIDQAFQYAVSNKATSSDDKKSQDEDDLSEDSSF